MRENEKAADKIRKKRLQELSSKQFTYDYDGNIILN
jgi:hypothetical protein